MTFLKDIAESSFIFQEPDMLTSESVEMKKKWKKHYRSSPLPRFSFKRALADLACSLATEHSLEVAITRINELPEDAFKSIEPILAVLNDLGSPPGDKPLKRAQLWMPLRHALTGCRVRLLPSRYHKLSFVCLS